VKEATKMKSDSDPNAKPAKMEAEVQSDVRKNPRRIAFILRRT